jgi:hypothetical protein
MKVTFTKEELESIIVEHNDKEDDITSNKSNQSSETPVTTTIWDCWIT